MLVTNLINAVTSATVSSRASLVPLNQIAARTADDFFAGIPEETLDRLPYAVMKNGKGLVASEFTRLTSEVIPLESPDSMRKIFKEVSSSREDYKRQIPECPIAPLAGLADHGYKGDEISVFQEQYWIDPEKEDILAVGLKTFLIYGGSPQCEEDRETVGMMTEGLHLGVVMAVLRRQKPGYLAAWMGLPEGGTIASSLLLCRAFSDSQEFVSLCGVVYFSGDMREFEVSLKRKMPSKSQEMSLNGIFACPAETETSKSEYASKEYSLVATGLDLIYGEVSPWIPALLGLSDP